MDHTMDEREFQIPQPVNLCGIVRARRSCESTSLDKDFAGGSLMLCTSRECSMKPDLQAMRNTRWIQGILLSVLYTHLVPATQFSRTAMLYHKTLIGQKSTQIIRMLIWLLDENWHFILSDISAPTTPRQSSNRCQAAIIPISSSRIPSHPRNRIFRTTKRIHFLKTLKFQHDESPQANGEYRQKTATGYVLKREANNNYSVEHQRGNAVINPTLTSHLGCRKGTDAVISLRGDH